VIWLGASSSTITDETAGPHLEFADAAANTEEAVSYDDDHVVKALATELKGQQWDADKPGWK